MSRIYIEPPEHWLFHTRISVHIGDINYGNHLANDAVLRLCHEARLRLLASFGFSEMDVGGTGLIMLDAALQFQGQGFYGDELDFDLGIIDLSNTGFSLIYRICRVHDGAAIAMVKTGMAFFNYQRQRISRTPEIFRNALAQSY
ncbi:acyl-CoA thioesterase [Snodgrassella alvi]|jgi:acyl-CoA thioester hydrolase|nr:thioesterase family protein [Snodgrassella alvi]PIT07020.1 esterase [Snodgrassella alvi]PIT23927.1 esterase [Snodgrassella alvi]PIT48335.1 esterase [Snodgrassella alvi]PIT56444.1 esterase [Snodgrassella alvi]